MKQTLVSLDLRGNNLSPNAVRALSAALPVCDILWSIPLGSARFDSDSTQVTAARRYAIRRTGTADLLFRAIASGCTALTDAAAVRNMAESMPGVEFRWSVDVFGQSYPSDTKQID